MPLRAAGKWLVVYLGLVAAACGGAPDRPPVAEVAGTTDHIVAAPGTPRDGNTKAQTTDEPCEHGSVVECKVWLTDVDCFTGLAVCDHGALSGCMDANAAEATLASLTSAVE